MSKCGAVRECLWTQVLLRHASFFVFNVLQAAVALLHRWQCTDGLFLIRTSTRAWGVHVLTMAVRNTPYHFQIKSKVRRSVSRVSLIIIMVYYFALGTDRCA